MVQSGTWFQYERHSPNKRMASQVRDEVAKYVAFERNFKYDN